MPASASHILRHAATAAALALVLAGCQTRYDASGNRIYVWQFGQSTDRAVDYSNPRLPILPPLRPREELWPIPSPYQFNDLSRYSFLTPPLPVEATIARVSDNPGCAAACETNARLALMAPRADARDGGRTITSR